LAPAVCAADFSLPFIALPASAASSLRFSFASFFGPSFRRFSSRRILFLKFFGFMMCPPARNKGESTIGSRVNDKTSLMSRSSLVSLIPIKRRT
jgi:hypothetical protein